MQGGMHLSFRAAGLEAPAPGASEGQLERAERHDSERAHLRDVSCASLCPVPSDTGRVRSPHMLEQSGWLEQRCAAGLGSPFKKTASYNAAEYFYPADDEPADDEDGGYEEDNNEPLGS
jgi:hypothetical protein